MKTSELSTRWISHPKTSGRSTGSLCRPSSQNQDVRRGELHRSIIRLVQLLDQQPLRVEHLLIRLGRHHDFQRSLRRIGRLPEIYERIDRPTLESQRAVDDLDRISNPTHPPAHFLFIAPQKRPGQLEGGVR